nr:adenylate/guanylate cyclase domain-containing protein [Rhizobium sp. G21]
MVHAALWPTVHFAHASLAVFVAIQAGQAMIDYAQERKSRQRITKAFAQYLAPELVHQLARDPSRLRLGGEKRELSILFCDVRGFTTIAEQLKDDPEQLTTLINRLLTPLSDIVLARGGTIDKYIGDCLMAFWNAPLESPDHAYLSVSAALDMLDAMEALNRTLEADARAHGRRHFPLRIGVGVNTGDCVVGNMGSTARFDYSVLGDAVNLASRLEGASKLYDVPLLIGVETARIIGDRLAVFELDRIIVKGKTEEAPVFTVLRTASAAVLALHRALLDAHYGANPLKARELAMRLADENPALAGYYARFDIIAADEETL